MTELPTAVDEAVATIRGWMTVLTPEQRLDVRKLVSDGFCPFCGQVLLASGKCRWENAEFDVRGNA